MRLELSKKLTAVGAIGFVIFSACAKPQEEIIDKRIAKASPQGSDQSVDEPRTDDPSAPGPDNSDSDPNAVIDETVLNFSGVAYQLAAGSDLVSPEFFANILLTSKVSENTVILYGKDGNSWIYGQDGNLPPQAISPFIAAPEDRQLITMDQDDFWLVGTERVSKRKAVSETNPNQIVLHNYDLTKLSGDPAQLKILGATHQSLILYLGSHIAILSAINGETAAYQFKAKLPGIEGEALSAGDTNDGGYWIATANRFAIIKQIDSKWHWNVAEIPNNLEGFSSLAAIINVAEQRILGESVAITSQNVYSISGAPINEPAP